MQSFDYYYETYGEYGEVDQINVPVIIAKGLPNVQLKEIVLFETGQTGWVTALNPKDVEILLLTQEKIPIGTKIVRTQQVLSIPVGDYAIGRTLNPLGHPVDGGQIIPANIELRPIDSRPKGIKFRSRIKRPFKTGTTIVDIMIPLGYGQKELIIGDRKVGKSSFVLTAIKQQISEGVIPIYCLIGKKKNDIKAVEELLEDEGLKQYVCILSSSSYDPPSSIYLTPFSAMTLAEYFAEQGKDVLLIFDDLFTHAKFYRELSLVSNNFPGRDSYPGDIFYTHARLLERAGNFKHVAKGEVAITCFPIVETVEGDITGYIQTNLMGTTDGHILFDTEIFSNGRRPAVNVQLSVTRAGRQTQTELNKTITRELTSFLNLYEQMQNLSHFGAELTPNVLGILKKGDMILKFFNQAHLAIIPESLQLVLFGLIWLDIIEDEKYIPAIRSKFLLAYQQQHIQDIFRECITANSLNEMLSHIAKNKDTLMKLWQ